MTRKSNSASQSLRKFMNALLEPRPDAELLDTHHNTLLRRARRKEWRKASARTGYFRALLELKRAEYLYVRNVVRDSKRADRIFGRHREAVDRLLRDAEAMQILTPAPDQAALQWKRKVVAADEYLPLAAVEIAAAIAADEAWLAAHPTKRSAEPVTPH